MLLDRSVDLRDDTATPAEQACWRTLIGPMDGVTSTLKVELYRRFVTAILDGRLAPGTILPSTRVLAQTLHVARNTVIHAYLQLAAEGVIETRDRSGHRVARADSLPARPPPGAGGRAPDRPPFAWHDRMVGSVARLPRLDRDRRWRGCRYPFIYGQYDRSLFPLAEWREVQRESLAVSAIRHWAGEPYDEDDRDLIEQIRSRILPQRGIWAAPDEILVTSGVQSAIAMIATLFLAAGFRCAVEEPSNPDLRAALRMRTTNIQHVDVDAEGLRVGDLSPGVSLLVCAPRIHYPTTAAMSPARRTQLRHYARTNGTIIVELDLDGEPFPGLEAALPLKADDPDGQVISIGDFSKGLSPALRLGFLVGPAEVVRELRYVRRLIARSPPTNNQRTLAEFVKRGYFDRLIRRMSAAYHGRGRALTEAIGREMPGLDLSPIVAGCSGWLALPAVADVRDLSERLLRESVYVEPGHIFHQFPPGRPSLQLGYSCLSEELIPEGVAIMARVMRQSGIL